ncbi:unnamed protein product [Thlaspi arvense]|uniref:Uncharacterized protein n=1 Tax=Thlaspi arvense TaxID=13288 RepID=A0AAU9RPK0_THLAR|nr:unnamed protein product [Thlaspi arvense]
MISPMSNQGRVKSGRGSVSRLAAPNISQRPGGSTPSRTPTPLPSQYNFTPSSQPPVTEIPQSQVSIYSPQPHFRDFPPPQQLFHDSPSQQPEIGNSSSSLQNQNTPSPPVQPSPASTHHHSQAQSNQSSAAQPFHG